MPVAPVSRRLVCFLVAIAVVASACGGDDDPELSVTDAATATPAADDPVQVEEDETPEQTATAVPEDDENETEEAGSPGEEPVAPGGGEAVPTPTQAPVSGEPAFTSASKLSTVGLDEIFFGDSVEDAATKASTEWVGLPPEGSSPQCYTVQPAGGPAGVVFTVLDGRIERVDITNPAITTRSGAGVGSTQAQLFDLFGERLEETEFEEGSNIMFVPADADDKEFRIIWTTDGLAAVKMRAGRTPGVLADAPCG